MQLVSSHHKCDLVQFTLSEVALGAQIRREYEMPRGATLSAAFKYTLDPNTAVLQNIVSRFALTRDCAVGEPHPPQRSVVPLEN